jgi:ABC-2 type transport system ATP-binding protein
VFGYIGPNGAGKTTTLKILAGLIRADSGEVTIGGRPAPAQDLVGYMPQSTGFQLWRTVESALDSLGALSGVSAEVRKTKIPALLDRLGLAAARHKKVKELSGGMTQKLGLIQALLHSPKLLILDEPLEGLDPASRALLKEIILERKRAGTTVLFSSHILSDVEDVADRIGILSAGKILATGSVHELIVAYGLPPELELELSAPCDLAFLGELGAVREVRAGVRRVVLEPKSDTDAVIHGIVERVLAGGGKIRRIGPVEPALDELFARILGGAPKEAAHA